MSDFILLLFGVIGASLFIQAVWDLGRGRQTGGDPRSAEAAAVIMVLSGWLITLSGLVLAVLVAAP
ncbi:hypothetical protein [Streptomyces beijiangensis]|uniref:Uncharacterized protein n=1 Tax=Streptomyces beijiangensis TaxID=163361 RepID=A0A939F7F2_9ACTN|nr:hypothetical protein [Streptomyces beijiangensis]MBO0513206.1 hypothetical protein [Streptomyces beijiangensis]